MKTCINCGKEIPTKSLFCSYCGSKQEEEIETKPLAAAELTPETIELPQDVNATVAPQKSKRAVRIVSIIRNSIIMALSILLLVASFLPIISIDMEDYEYIPVDDLEIKFNTFEYVVLFFDSLKDLEEDDLSDLQEEFDEIEEEAEDLFYDTDFKDLTLQEKKLLKKVIFIYTRAAIQLDKGGPSASLVFIVIFGVLNIILSVALFVFALLNLLATFNIINRGKALIYKCTVALITASPAVILATYYAGNIYFGGGLSAVAVWSIICSVVVVVMLMVFRYIFSKRDTVSNLVARSIALALSLAVFCLAFAPVFSVTLKRYKNAKVTHGADFFEELVISDEESDMFDSLRGMTKNERKEYLKNELEAFSDMSKKEIESDYGVVLNSKILVELLGVKLAIPEINAFSLTVLFFILTVIASLLIVWQSLYFFSTGRHVKLVVFISKICTLAATAGAIVMTIVFLTMTASFARDYFGSSYKMSIGTGVIFMIIFAIGAMFCPTSLAKKVRKTRPVKIGSSYEDFEEQF